MNKMLTKIADWFGFVPKVEAEHAYWRGRADAAMGRGTLGVEESAKVLKELADRAEYERNIAESIEYLLSNPEAKAEHDELTW